MIDRLSGLVASRLPDYAVLDVGGVGFRLEMSSTSLRDLPPEGEQVVVLTYLLVREDALQLYGFSTEDERELFQLLLSVSKIGPKIALAALSVRRPREVRRAIALGDVALFQSIPGIGKKTAERLILELREKVGELVVEGGSRGEPSGADGMVSLARAALQELGLTAAEAEQRLQGLDPEQPLEELVRKALTRQRG
jgi:holliday junction DNA helicase RuvA